RVIRDPLFDQLQKQLTKTRRHLQRQLKKSMRAIAREMATYSDERLRELAIDPDEREAMEKVLADCRGAIARSDSTMAKATLSIQARRLQEALDNPAVPA